MEVIIPYYAPWGGRLRRQWLLVSCWLLVGGALGFSGCAGFSRSRDASQVVAARQLTLRGLEQLQHGDLAGAEQSFQQAVEASPHDERARFQYAKMLWRRQASLESFEHMNEAVRLSGGVPELLVELGGMHLAMGDLPRAQQCAERAIATDSHCAAAHVLRGDIARRRGQYEEALEHYHWALDVAEHFPAAQIAAAEIYHKKEKPRRALASLHLLDPAKLPSEQARRVQLLRGIAHNQLGRPQEAIRSLSATSPHDPPDAEWLHHLAEAHLLAGNPSTAAQIARQALAVDSSRANTQSLLARIEAAAQRVAISSGPTDPMHSAGEKAIR